MMTMRCQRDENGEAAGAVPYCLHDRSDSYATTKARRCPNQEGNVIDPLDMVDGISLRVLEKRTGSMMRRRWREKIRKRTEAVPEWHRAAAPTPCALPHGGASLDRPISTGIMKRLEGYR